MRTARMCHTSRLFGLSSVGTKTRFFIDTIVFLISEELVRPKIYLSLLNFQRLYVYFKSIENRTIRSEREPRMASPINRDCSATRLSGIDPNYTATRAAPTKSRHTNHLKTRTMSVCIDVGI